jgi:hypothetical protein
MILRTATLKAHIFYEAVKVFADAAREVVGKAQEIKGLS